MAAERHKVWSAGVASDESQSNISYSQAQHSAVVTSAGAPQDAMVAKARTYLRTVIILSGIGLGLSVLMMVFTGVALAASSNYYDSVYLDKLIGVPTAFVWTVPQLVFFGVSLALAIRARQRLPYFADVQQHNCCCCSGMTCMVIFNSIMLLVAIIGTIILMIVVVFLSTKALAAYVVVSVLGAAVCGLDITMLVFHILLLCRQHWKAGARIGVQGGATTTTTNYQNIAGPATTMPQQVIASPSTAPKMETAL